MPQNIWHPFQKREHSGIVPAATYRCALTGLDLRGSVQSSVQTVNKVYNLLTTNYSIKKATKV